MNLITDSERQQLLANGRAQRQAIRYGAGDCIPADLHPVVKLFTPDAAATWLLTELDPDDEDLAFGLCDLGLGSPELGYVRLSELANACGPLRLRIERDLHFEADKPISAYAVEAHEHRRIRA